MIFIKGGFVGVPVGLAAVKLHIPFVTHDSDSEPGLANRIIGRWAAAHAVALQKSIYPYPQDITYSVGVPINHHFMSVNSSNQNQFKSDIGLNSENQVLCVTGGGNGAKQLNNIVIKCSPIMLGNNPSLFIVHLAGRAHVTDTIEAYRNLLSAEQFSRVVVKGFVPDLYKYSGASDLIIGRGSATNLAE